MKKPGKTSLRRAASLSISRPSTGGYPASAWAPTTSTSAAIPSPASGFGSETGLLVKKLLCDEEGVDPTRVVLGHSGDSTNADHLSELAEGGFILGMDRFGINLDPTFEGRCDIVVELCRRGYADRMVLSQDASCYIDWIDPRARAGLPQWHYLHLHDEVLPYLREHGVSDDQVDAMLVRTPRRYFEHTDPY